MAISPLPLISIVTVCRNAASVLEGTIRSVLEQDYPALEYYVIDGASSDNTAEVLQYFAPLFAQRGIGFQVVSEADRGIYDAMNKGILAAQGEWINFMNAGDAFPGPHTVSRLFSETPAADVGVLYGNIVLHKVFGFIEIKPKPLSRLAKKMAFCHQAAFVRTEYLREHLFDLRYTLAADYESFRYLWQKGVAFAYRDIPVAIFEAEAGASSSNRLKVNRENAQIRGIDRTWRWRIQFLFKSIEVGLKEGLQLLVPQVWVQSIREANYRRIQRNRCAHEKKAALSK